MNGEAQAEFVGNRVRDAGALTQWHARAVGEAAVDVDIPIVDAHHHLYGSASDAHHYLLGQFHGDLAGGHRVLGTVYVEAYYSGWRTSGPAEMRPVGEIDFITALTRTPLSINGYDCQVAAGIVSHADLTRGDAAADVIAAEMEAAEGRLRGVRHITAYSDGAVGRTIFDLPKPLLLADPMFRRGVAQLQRFGLSFDVWCYHYQVPELASLADAFPDTTMVLNHVGGVIGVAEFRANRDEVRLEWARNMRELARRPNVVVKVGGMGMPVFGFGFEHERRPATSTELANAWRPFIDVCVETFGPKRCLFESNFPVDKQSAGYTELWNAFKIATRALSPEERRDMFYRTASRVYRLPELAKTGDAMGRAPTHS